MIKFAFKTKMGNLALSKRILMLNLPSLCRLLSHTECVLLYLPKYKGYSSRIIQKYEKYRKNTSFLHRNLIQNNHQSVPKHHNQTDDLPYWLLNIT